MATELLPDLEVVDVGLSVAEGVVLLVGVVNEAEEPEPARFVDLATDAEFLSLLVSSNGAS